jgi:hypothetical protein
VTDPAEQRALRAEELAQREEARVAALRQTPGLGPWLDGPRGAALGAGLARLRSTYRRLRRALRLPT